MISSKARQAINQYNVKVCLLGGTEQFKNAFQKFMSDDSLPMKTKENLGVNISKKNFPFRESIIEFNLWNISCDPKWSFLRSSYYSGAAALIIFISETRVEQISDYFNEIVSRIPDITIIFNIITHEYSKVELTEVYFEHGALADLIKKNQFKFENLSESMDLFEYLSSSFISKKLLRGFRDQFIINFIPDRVILNNGLHESCHEYIEPVHDIYRLNEKRRLNASLLKKYISSFQVEDLTFINEWVQLKIEKYGTFSIYLKNGNVYFNPKECEKCPIEGCSKSLRAPHFICIEATDKGWSNIKGFYSQELLLLSKIYALKNDMLPKAVLKQIQGIRKCIIKNRNK